VNRAYRLGRDEEPAAGMRRVALGRAESAIERLREAERMEDPATAIHGARKELKKLRALVRLLRSALGEDVYRVEKDRYRDAGRLLSATRDSEVKLRTLEALHERFPERLGDAIGEWQAELTTERDGALAGARRDASIAAARNAVEAGCRRIASWPLSEASWKLVGPGIERSYRRGRLAMRRADADPSDGNLHEWRKRAKDLWYHLRVLEGVLPTSLAGAVDEADRLADALGDHHDLAVLREDLFARDLATTRRPDLAEAIEERQAELVAAALAQGGSLYAKRPKAFMRKLRRGWKRRRS
jgi:CHAD domain-containing protein